MPASRLIELPENPEPSSRDFNPLNWTLTIDGLVRSKKHMKYGEILFLRNEIRIDDYRPFGWDPPQVTWEGFPVRYILSLTQPTERARMVVFHSEAFKKALTIAEVLEYNPLLAFKLNGEIVSRDKGGPLRLVFDDGTDHYGVKWISRLEVTDDEKKEQG